MKFQNEACKFIEKGTLEQVSSYEFWEKFKNTFFYKTSYLEHILWNTLLFTTSYFKELIWWTELIQTSKGSGE